MKWVLRTSRIIVGTDAGKAVFRSLEECPPNVKQRLQETLPGRNACTIMITNREALEAIRDRTIQAPASTARPASRAQESNQRMVLPRWQVAAVFMLALSASMVGLLVWAMHSN